MPRVYVLPTPPHTLHSVRSMGSGEITNFYADLQRIYLDFSTMYCLHTADRHESEVSSIGP